MGFNSKALCADRQRCEWRVGGWRMVLPARGVLERLQAIETIERGYTGGRYYLACFSEADGTVLLTAVCHTTRRILFTLISKTWRGEAFDVEDDRLVCECYYT
jgi:hypothetical protein